MERRRAFQEYVKCEGDPYYFITHYCRTQLAPGKVALIPSWPYIQEAVEALCSFDDLLIEKTRQMLLSWTVMAFDLWGLLFYPGYASFVGSRKQDLVDDGGENSSWQSLLGKVRFMHQHLPSFLKGDVRFKQLHVEYPTRGSFIVGESANPDMGRGGTYTRATLDEAARLPHSEQAYGSLRLGVARGLALVSTPYGRVGLFPRVRFTPSTVPWSPETVGSPGFKRLRFHWTQHPDRAQGLYVDAKGKQRSPWYDRVCETMTEDQIARELDINYSGSVAGRCYNEFEYDTHVDPTVEYSDRFPLMLLFDFGIDNPTAVLFAQCKDPYLDIIAEYEKSNLVVEDHVDNIMQITRDLGVIVERASFRGYGDPAGDNRDPAKGQSTIMEYRAHGLHISYRKSSVRDRVELVKLKFKHGRIRVHPRCDHFIECLQNIRWKRDRDGEPIKEEKREPGWATHLVDAFEYGAVNLWPDELKHVAEMRTAEIITDADESDVAALGAL